MGESLANSPESLNAHFSGIYAIIDALAHRDYGLRRLLDDLVMCTRIPVIQLRLKNLPRPEILGLLDNAAALKSSRLFFLIINDNAEFLEHPSVDGIHLGQGDGDVAACLQQYPQKIIGVSAHNLVEARVAVRNGASYLGCGCIYPTYTKKNVTRLSLVELREIVQASTIPVVAIGGIGVDQLAEIKSVGAAMAVVASGLVRGPELVAPQLEKIWGSL